MIDTRKEKTVVRIGGRRVRWFIMNDNLEYAEDSDKTRVDGSPTSEFHSFQAVKIPNLWEFQSSDLTPFTYKYIVFSRDAGW